MTFSFRPAKRSEAKPLIGLYSQSGGGKTMGALLLARGFVGPQGKVGMIETESGRGEAYADIIQGGYDVISMRDDYSPLRYGEALTAAEKAGLGALIIDSASHEWESAGGVLDLAAQNQAAGKKGPLVWQQPKMLHQRHFMLRLLATPIPLVIVCMRAKYPMQEKTINGRKEWVRSDDLEPIQASDILYEMFVHGWLDQHHRLHVTKLTRPDLGQVFRDGELITLETGQRLAAWTRESNPQPAAVQVQRPAADAAPSQLAQPQPSPRDGAAPSDSERLMELDLGLQKAAKNGMAALETAWAAIESKDDRKTLKSALERRHKPVAVAADDSRALTTGTQAITMG